MAGISFSYQAILGKYEPLVWPQMESLTVDLYLLVTKSFSARKLRFLRHKGYINVGEKLEMLATDISAGGGNFPLGRAALPHHLKRLKSAALKPPRAVECIRQTGGIPNNELF